MDNKKKELYKIDNNEFRESIDINEDDYFRQSKSINNNPENSLSQTKVFDNNKKVAIPFTTERIFKKSDFEIQGLLGRGSYAKVVKAKLIENDTIYAIKIIDKTFIEKEKKLYQIYLENEILHQISHVNLIKIFGIFEENDKIYIVLEYCENGDFYEFLKNNSPLPFETAQFYAGQIVSSLEYLHNLDIAHRDLKPENIMLDSKMHLKIIDFATAKIRGKEFDKSSMKFKILSNDELKLRSKKRNTFVGTAEYVSPEVLGDGEVGPEADLWALGCIIYQMYIGQTPFKDKTEYLVFRKIQDGSLSFPKEIPNDAANLIKSLLMRDPLKRLGSGCDGMTNDFTALKKHDFFKGLNYNSLSSMPLPHQNTLKIKVFFKESPKIARDDLERNNVNNKGEFKILKEGIVKKKSPWFHYNTRKLILYNTPKLEYLDTIKNVLKGNIYLAKDCKATVIEKDRFDVNTPKRTYIFKTDFNDALAWVKLINEAINLA